MMTLLFRELTTGRIGRGAFAKGLCAYLALLLAAGALVAAAMNGDDVAHPGLAALGAALAILAVWSGLVLQVKRVRDWGVSGWWFLAFTLLGAIPALGALAGLVFLVMCLAVPRDAFMRASAGPGLATA